MQFVISIALIIGTLTIYKQMEYIHNRSLGFDKENVVVIPIRNNRVLQNIDAFRNAIANDSHIISASISSNLPGSSTFNDVTFRQDDSNETHSLLFIATDYDFIDTYRLDVTHGRSFSKEFSTDTQGAIILNEAAAREIGYTPEDAVGRKLIITTGDNQFSERTVVGVTSDFHFRSLHQRIRPLLLVCNLNFVNAISVRIAPGDVRSTVDFIKKQWTETFPADTFDYSFLDENINLLYESEERMRSIFTVFSILSIFVACLGLFSLAAFTAEERTKEISVRKVLGASVANIILLLSKEFTKWVLLANIVAWPLAWYLMNKWLENFAYRTNIGFEVFVASAVLTLMIALLTVGFQAIKAARTKLVDSLKYE